VIGKNVDISSEMVTRYLEKVKISEADLGGQISNALPQARYFVIHDTSFMLPAGVRSFPSSINDSSWNWNRRDTFKRAKDAHVFISRVGTSNTAHDFSVPYSATKYTMHQTSALKLKFCHVELIQPRLDNHGSDWQAPNPGFPGVQLERLALVYIAASVRHGAWLIPAYHHNVDMGLPAHDDPQNFDFQGWTDKIEEIVKDILGVIRPGDFPTSPDNKNLT
jgi:hypothetical protein